MSPRETPEVTYIDDEEQEEGGEEEGRVDQRPPSIWTWGCPLRYSEDNKLFRLLTPLSNQLESSYRAIELVESAARRHRVKWFGDRLKIVTACFRDERPEFSRLNLSGSSALRSGIR